MLYEILTNISNLFIMPIMNLAYQLEHIPILFAFFLGLVGALAPCQLTSNISAITIYGNQSITEKIPWRKIIAFIIGKLFVFSLLGTVIYFLGNEIHQTLSSLMPYFRKAIGPLLIFIGLFMLGLFKWEKLSLAVRIPPTYIQNTYIGSFLLGVSFTIAFCPTMFVLFLLTLMPIVMVTSYGVLLPAVFGIGTTLPLIIVIFLISYFGASGIVLRKSRAIGIIIQKVAGIILIIIGFFDLLTYWT